MQFFNFKGFWRFTKKLIFKPKHPKRSLKRISWLVNFYLVYPIWELIVWSGLIFDRIFYPKFKNVDIKEPIFILGNPRSGTTYLHRLLAKDKKNFITMKTWEIFAAPSIMGRKIIRKLAELDRQIGKPGRKKLEEVEYNLHKDNPMHKTGFWQAEEDDWLFLHIWSSIKAWTLSGKLKEAKTYVYFDKLMPQEDKDRILKFYKKCLQRHLFFHQTKGKHYLSKNPNFTPMIDGLRNQFPDCKIIYLVRSPLQVIPSYVSMLQGQAEVLDDQITISDIGSYVLKMAKHWYAYPLQMLDQMPKSKYEIIRLEDLSQDVRETVEKMYKKFNLPLSRKFTRKLSQATQKSRRHKSNHKYTLQNTGLTKKEIISEFKEIFTKFNF
jgi:omega-hydroxy-beta-dihydromenaquinone-9 sulfotransferase